MKHVSRCLFALAVLILPLNQLALAQKSNGAGTYTFGSPYFASYKFKGKQMNYSLTNLEFEHIESNPNTFVMNELFHMVEFRRVGENFSMGVTKKGLKLCVDW